MRANDCIWYSRSAAGPGVRLWFSGCGEGTQVFVGTPHSNHWTTCPFCGGYLVEEEPDA